MNRNHLHSLQPYCVILLGITCLLADHAGAPAELSAQQPVAASTNIATPSGRPATLVFTGGTVVDMTDGRLLPEQTVVIAGNRVQAVGPARQISVPAGAQMVDARGKYLIPGLWDMHTHVDNRPNTLYPRFIAHGVTGIREMGHRFEGGTDSFQVWQREVATGARVGPRSVGPNVEITERRFIITSPDDVRRIVDSLKAAGITFLKVHGTGAGNNPPLYFAILSAARRVGLPVVGHTPDEVKESDVADSGQRSIEHVNEHQTCWAVLPGGGPKGKVRRGSVNMDSILAADSVRIREQCGPTAASFIRNGTWLTPTLVTLRAYDVQGAPSLVRVMHRFGVRRFLAGTDAPLGGRISPGFSLLQELIYSAESGRLTPLEALQTATLNPAQFFNATDSLGTVTAGKLADLLLLDANPLADIRNVLTIQAVVANGRYFDRAALDSLDPKGVESAKAFAEQRPSWATPTSTTP